MDAQTTAGRSWAYTLERFMAETPSHVLTLRCTLLLLLLYGASDWRLDVLLRILCGMMLLGPSLVVNRTLWLALLGVTTWANASTWYSIDNHKYLITYWCLACTFAISSKNPDDVLRFNGKLLIGFCFLFAFFWKLIAGEYLNGAFLHLTFLTDGRLDAPARLIGGIDASAMAMNRKLFSALTSHPMGELEISLTSSPRLRLATLVCSYWTLLVEGGVAWVFLSGWPRWLSERRDWLLMLFIVTTYFLLPVVGFAFVLALMGLAQCPIERKMTRIAWLVILVLIQLSRIPWGKFV